MTAPNAQDTADEPESVAVGKLLVDFVQRTAEFGSDRLELTSREYQVLEVLARRANTCVTKRMFFDAIYAPEGYEPELKIIDVYICNLRKKIKRFSEGVDYIETIWGRGYALRSPDEE